MNTNQDTPVAIPSPEQMQVLIRRAHKERSDAVKALFASLFARGKDGAPIALNNPQLSPIRCS